MRVDGDVDAEPCRVTAGEGAGGDGKPGASFLSQWAEEGDTSGISSAAAGPPGLQRSWGLEGGREDVVRQCLLVARKGLALGRPAQRRPPWTASLGVGLQHLQLGIPPL